jgi:hypothetical protein
MPEDTGFPDGPALLYVMSSNSHTGIHPNNDPRPVAFRADLSRITEGGVLSADDARRERMLLRALLNQALYLLGPEEGEY